MTTLVAVSAWAALLYYRMQPTAYNMEWFGAPVDYMLSAAALAVVPFLFDVRWEHFPNWGFIQMSTTKSKTFWVDVIHKFNMPVYALFDVTAIIYRRLGILPKCEL